MEPNKIMSITSCPNCRKLFPISYPLSDLSNNCEKNNYTEVCSIVMNGNNANTVLEDSKYYTPLHIAANSGSKETVLVLLSHGAIPDICNNEGFTALHIVRNI